MKIDIMSYYPLADMRYAAMATKGILSDASPKDLTSWALSTILAEHSIISEARIRVTDATCRSDVVSHLVRHTKGHPRHYVQSKRPDWTGEPRPSDPSAPRIYVSTWPTDALLAMARQRLCYLAAKYTRAWAMNVKTLLLHLSSCAALSTADQEAFADAVSLAMVPNCVYRGGCPEGKRTCGYWKRMQEEYEDQSLEQRLYTYRKSGAFEAMQQIPVSIET